MSWQNRPAAGQLDFFSNAANMYTGSGAWPEGDSATKIFLYPSFNNPMCDVFTDHSAAVGAGKYPANGFYIASTDPFVSGHSMGAGAFPSHLLEAQASQQNSDVSSGYSSGPRYEAISPDLGSISSTSDDTPQGGFLENDTRLFSPNFASTSSESLNEAGDSTGNSNTSSPTLPAAADFAYSSQLATCAVCGDKASGLHYGIHSCEGCKGFFRRSVQKNLTYKCHKHGACLVSRVTRNRCQACRFQRCLVTGMSKDAVRGEKQRKSSKSKKEEHLDRILPVLSAGLRYMVDQIIVAHENTSQAHHSERDNAMTVVTNPFTDIVELSESAATQVMEFVKQLPGFHSVPANDRLILLKFGCLEIMLLRMCYNFDLHSQRFVLSGGLYLTEDVSQRIGLGDVMTDLMDFAKMLASMRMDRTMIALLSAFCYFSADRAGLQNGDMIRMSQNPIAEAMKILMVRQQPTRPYNLTHLLMRLVKLRTVATKCSDKIRNGQFPLLPQMLSEILAPKSAEAYSAFPTVTVPKQEPLTSTFGYFGYQYVPANQSFHHGVTYHGQQ